MRVLLIIFAGVVALFAGGCAIVFGSAVGPAALPLFAVAAANVVLIVGVTSSERWAAWYLWVFAAVDLGLATLAVVLAGNDKYAGPFVIAAAVVLLAKAALEFLVGAGIRRARDREL
jgi:hypothetical protein